MRLKLSSAPLIGSSVIRSQGYGYRCCVDLATISWFMYNPYWKHGNDHYQKIVLRIKHQIYKVFIVIKGLYFSTRPIY